MSFSPVSLLFIIFLSSKTGAQYDFGTDFTLGSGSGTDSLTNVDFTGYQAYVVSDAGLFCYNAYADRMNARNLYAHPDDCHKYYQCYAFNETYITGVERQCAPGQFFREEILQCGPEGETPCQDQCRDHETARHGCYLSTRSCSTYYVCSNTISYQMCCPSGTSFNESSCSCVADNNCFDPCIIKATPTAPPAPPKFNETFCTDSFGNILKRSPNGDLWFTVVDIAGDFVDGNFPTYDQECAPGSKFDLSACRCDLFTDENIQSSVPSRQCKLYLNFEKDIDDQSVNKFAVTQNGYTTLSTHHVARGRGALFLDGGFLEIAGLKTSDLRSQGSWCFFYRCYDGMDSIYPSRCTNYGGLLSNNKDSSGSEFTVNIASSPSSIIAALRFQNLPEMDITLIGEVKNENQTDEDLFTQVCLVYDGYNINLYMENELVSSVASHANMTLTQMAHSPYVVGTDPLYGDFQGFIDELLICDHAMTPQDVDAHFQGQGALFAAGMVPYPPAASTRDFNFVKFEEAWQKYKKDFKRNFKSQTTESEHKELFRKRWIQMNNHNELFENGFESYRMEIHPAMDQPWQSLASGKLGFSGFSERASLRSGKAKQPQNCDNVAIPMAYDHRSSGCVNDVRDQLSCGACFSFATMACVEAALCKLAKRKIPLLSVQYLLQCSADYNNEGCNGGLMTDSFEFLIDYNILYYESDWKYRNNADKKCPELGQKGPVFNPPRARLLPKLVSYVVVDSDNELALQKAIMCAGTVACAIDVTPLCLAYKSGVYNDPYCSNDVPNHAVNCVGFGCTAVTRSGACVGQKFWVIRNSWGPQWGEKGYMRFIRGGRRHCGLLKMCSYVIAA